MKRVDRLNKHGEKEPGLPEKTKSDGAGHYESQLTSGPGWGKSLPIRVMV